MSYLTWHLCAPSKQINKVTTAQMRTVHPSGSTSTHLAPSWHHFIFYALVRQPLKYVPSDQHQTFNDWRAPTVAQLDKTHHLVTSIATSPEPIKKYDQGNYAKFFKH
jgi:hypothetical protein